MAKLSRSTMIRFLILGVLALAANCWAQDRAPILEKVAKAYGLDSFDQVEAIRYTWNADIPGLFKASHQWEWEPKTNKVTFEGTDKDGKAVKVTYTRFDASQPDAVKTKSSLLSSTITIGCCSLFTPTGTKELP